MTDFEVFEMLQRAGWTRVDRSHIAAARVALAMGERRIAELESKVSELKAIIHASLGDRLTPLLMSIVRSEP